MMVGGWLLMLLPFLIISVLVIGLIIFVNRSRIHFATSKKIIALYCIALLLSPFIYYMAVVPAAMTAPDEMYERNEQSGRIRGLRGIWPDATYNISQLLEDGELIIDEQWNFDHAGGYLKLTATEHYPNPIFVKQDEDLHGQIKVVYFTYPPSLKNIPELELSGDQLNISPVRNELIHFAHDFTAAQFTGKGVMMADHLYFNKAAEHFLYLLIPSDLEIAADQGISITYI